MTPALKCPNPSCSYLFNPLGVPPGMMLVCPQCGMRFTLSAPASPAATVPGVGYPPPGSAPAGGFAAPSHFAPTSPALGFGPPPCPTAAPGPAAAASPFADMTPLAAKPDDQPGPRLPVQPSPLQHVLLFVVVAVGLMAAGIIIWYKLSYRDEEAPVTPLARFKDLNLGFEPPAEPWVRDEDMRVKLGPPYLLVYRRDNPEAFMAIGAKDYQTRSPRPSELEQHLSEAVARLVDKDTLKIHLDDPDAQKTWLGQPAQSFKFSGLQPAGGAIEGQAYATHYKGIGYWFLAWTGAQDIYQEQREEFAAGRARCRLLDARADWKEKQSPIVRFASNVHGYSLRDPDGIWTEITDEEQVKAEDPKADKFLVVYADPRKRNPVRKAELVVALLEGEGDPLQTAREHVVGRANALAELQGRWEFTELAEPPEADPPVNTVDGDAPYVLFRSTNEKNREYSRYYVVSAVRAQDKIVAVYAWCAWADRARFVHPLIQIARSLRAEG